MYISDDLKNDKKFVIELIKYNHRIINYIPKSLFEELRITEAEVAVVRGWESNYNAEEIKAEIHKALGKNPYYESKAFDTIFLDFFPSSEALNIEQKTFVMNHLKSTKMDENFKAVWDQSSLKAEITEERQKLLYQWNLLDIKERTEMATWFWDHQRVKDEISFVIKKLPVDKSDLLIEELITRMTTHAILVRSSYKHQEEKYIADMKIQKF
jgi:hypothetical protein